MIIEHKGYQIHIPEPDPQLVYTCDVRKRNNHRLGFYHSTYEAIAAIEEHIKIG